MLKGILSGIARRRQEKEAARRFQQAWEESQSPYGQWRLARDGDQKAMNAGVGFVRVSRTHAQLLELNEACVVGLG